MGIGEESPFVSLSTTEHTERPTAVTEHTEDSVNGRDKRVPPVSCLLDKRVHSGHHIVVAPTEGI